MEYKPVEYQIFWTDGTDRVDTLILSLAHSGEIVEATEIEDLDDECDGLAETVCAKLATAITHGIYKWERITQS